MKEKFLKVMFEIAEQGGKIALDLLSSSSPWLKWDQSPVTQADIAISKLAYSKLSPFLADKNHLILDEEDENNTHYLDQKALEKFEFIWAIDPIDGTRAFLNKTPHFGISIGLIRNLKPYLGLFYFPMFSELFFADEEAAYLVKNPFTDKEEKTLISPPNVEITPDTFFLVNDLFYVDFNWNLSYCQLLNPNCTGINLCWPLIGRGFGAIFRANLWDFAGAWPLIKFAGMELRAYKTGKVLETIDVDLFVKTDTKPWKLKDYHILSTPEKFAFIQQNITPKNDFYFSD